MFFSSVGFDIRVWPPQDPITTDATCWPKDEKIYEQMIAGEGLFENRYQLIQPKTTSAFVNLIDVAKNNNTINLIAILLPDSVIEALEGDGYRTIQADLSAWHNYGIDVCDLNGFFSILHMGVLKTKRENLFPEKEIDMALNLA